MSGICGYINLDGQPVQEEKITGMMEAMSYYGPDGSGKWVDGPAGLGHLLLYNTPESLNETLPLVSDSGNFVMTCTARVDNRDELFNALGVPHPDRKAMPDGTLILKTYEKWGEECCDKILGDWSCAVWDKREQRLFVGRDHHGITGLYYYHGSNFFAFASNLKPLLALPEVPKRLNELKLAQILVSWPAHGQPTTYEDILRLPPSHYLYVTKHRTEPTRYWYLENTPPLRLKSDDEYVEMFTDILTESVRCRMRSHKPVASTLSGGLDSGTVSVVAAQELKKEGKRLQCFSHVPMFDDIDHLYNSKSRFGNERPFIEATASHAGNIDVEFLKSEHISPLQGIQRMLDIHGEPGHAAGNMFWLVDIMQTANNKGIGTLLTGQTGNSTISWHCPGYLQSLMRKGQWLDFAKQLRLWQKKHKRPLWRAIAGQFVKPFVLAPFIKQYKQLRTGNAPWEAYSAINPEFAKRLNLGERMRDQGHDPTFGMSANPLAHQCKMIKPGENHLGCLWHENGLGFGVNVCDPTMDKRLQEFCLAIPDEQYFHEGTEKWLLKRAMQGILPNKVLWNRQKGLQSSDLVLRVRENCDEITRIIEDIQKSKTVCEYLAIDKMKSVLDNAVNISNSEVTKGVGTIFLRGLMAGIFVSRYEK